MGHIHFDVLQTTDFSFRVLGIQLWVYFFVLPLVFDLEFSHQPKLTGVLFLSGLSLLMV